MERRVPLPESYHLPGTQPSQGTSIAYGILALYVIYQLLAYFDYPILSPQELLWNALVFLIPTRLLLDAAKRQELHAANMLSQTHAAKSEALRRILGMGSGALTHKLSGGEGIMRRMSGFVAQEAPIHTDAPAGLGNWDNSCYQNSVLQGLASLDSLEPYLQQITTSQALEGSTSGSLLETMAKLKDPSNNGKELWTPAKLKSMSSWQQQDAQEYFSKIMDELDKEAARSARVAQSGTGLEAATEAAPENSPRDREAMGLTRNPVDGLLAQQVVCTRCGFSEGLSMIPFNCLTVPLGSDFAYDLQDCLDEYTKLEEISEVECAKCTLLRAEAQLKQMLPEHPNQEFGSDVPKASAVLSLPPELRLLAARRLAAIQEALENDDNADKTLSESCQIPKRAHVPSTKTRQAVIGRSPQSLIIHINRSVFDESTGAQRKNYATVQYPMSLDLSSWILGDESSRTAGTSMLGQSSNDFRSLYRLKAVVTHYGRHENGHYICYRRHPSKAVLANTEAEDADEQEHLSHRWWRLSDEDVSQVSEEDALGQGGVFLLFYEREELLTASATSEETMASETNVLHTETAALALEDAVAVPLPPDSPEVIAETSPAAAEATLITLDGPPSTGTTTEDEAEPTDYGETLPAPQSLPKAPTPPLMRTARGRQTSRHGSKSDGGFGSTFRAMAAT